MNLSDMVNVGKSCLRWRESHCEVAMSINIKNTFIHRRDTREKEKDKKKKCMRSREQAAPHPTQGAVRHEAKSRAREWCNIVPYSDIGHNTQL